MNEYINQENLNASMRLLSSMSEMGLNQLREIDPEAAKRQEQMNALFEDQDFVNKFMACEEKEAMIQLCAEYGCVMTMEELDALLVQVHGTLKKLVDNDGELTEEDLEQVAGGGMFADFFKGVKSAAVNLAMKVVMNVAASCSVKAIDSCITKLEGIKANIAKKMDTV